MPTNVLQSCVSKFFFLLSQDFTLLFEFYVFLFLLKLEHIETEREGQWKIEELSSLFYLKFSIKLYRSNVVYACSHLWLFSGQFFLFCFSSLRSRSFSPYLLTFILVLFHLVWDCFPKVYACVCFLCVKYVNNIHIIQKKKNLFRYGKKIADHSTE